MDEGLILFNQSGSATRAPDALALQTRKRWDIPNVVPDASSRELNAQCASAAHVIHHQSRGALVLRSLLGPYNCVGLVFGARRTMIDCEHIDRILREDGYRKVELQEVTLGDLVVYRSQRDQPPVHIGVVFAKPVSLSDPSLTILSKWGRDPEYLHDLRDVPETYGTIHEFFSERVTR